MAPDGSSLITSIGVPQSVLWIHDKPGDRPDHDGGIDRGRTRLDLVGEVHFMKTASGSST